MSARQDHVEDFAAHALCFDEIGHVIHIGDAKVGSTAAYVLDYRSVHPLRSMISIPGREARYLATIAGSKPFATDMMLEIMIWPRCSSPISRMLRTLIRRSLRDNRQGGWRATIQRRCILRDRSGAGINRTWWPSFVSSRAQ